MKGWRFHVLKNIEGSFRSVRPKRAHRRVNGCKKNSRQFPGFVINSYFKDNAFTLYNSQKQCKVLN